MTRTWSLPVAPEARAVVRSVWVVAADAPGPDEPMVPYGCMDLVWVARGAAWRVDGLGARRLPDLSVSGQTTRPYGLRLAPGTCVVGLGFHPHTGVAAAPVAARRLTDVAVSWADVADPATVRETAERLAEAVTLGTAAQTLQRAVVGLARRTPERTGAARVEQAVGAILAGETGPDDVSARYLQRVFGEIVGVAPGQLARTVRFLRALPLVAGDRPLTAVAHEVGYHDQAHFCRSFRRFTGATPSAWRAGDRLVDGFVAGWGGSLPYKPGAD